MSLAPQTGEAAGVSVEAPPAPVAEREWPRYLKLGLCVAAAAAVVALLVANVEGVNGPHWSRWEWQRLSWTRVIAGFALGAVPFVLAQVLFARGRWPAQTALKAVALSMFLLQLIAIGVREDPFSLSVGAKIIQHPLATSYFTDAVNLDGHKDYTVARWIEDYPKLAGSLSARSRTKPPGLILFHLALVRLFPGHTEAAATVGAVLFAFLASLGVFVVRRFIQVMTGDPARGFWGASLYALLPGLVVIHPMFDQLYPLVTCALVGTWWVALRSGRRLPAMACGLLTAATTFFIFSFLTLGVAFLGLAGLAWAFEQGPARARARKVGVQIG